MSAPAVRYLLQTRAGFERDAWQEVEPWLLERGVETRLAELTEQGGFLLVDAADSQPALNWSALAFTRQLCRVVADVELGERDRLSPLLAALRSRGTPFGSVWLEVPDTNDGKSLSSFTRKFQPLLEEGLTAAGLLDAGSRRRLHVYFPHKGRAILGVSQGDEAAPWPMGILRLRMPAEAPSRSTLKLAEAFEVFLGRDGQRDRLKEGMTAVDLGAAPGGWTWQLIRRGIKTYAIDNGPMKGACDGHPLVKHLRADGFRYRPQHPVDWLVCDMVEQPARVSDLIAAWFVGGLTRQAIFNLKLPMKKRALALRDALDRIGDALDAAEIRHTVAVKQLYHDREEVTVYLARVGGKTRGKRG